ncbi:MAG: TetR/AcrR family transcriptional regulator [Rhodoferax sp.]
MPRPSRNIDQALLKSGRALFPEFGCVGLSLRQLAEHAGVNVGMFHYHFQNKQNFLRTLLQQMYEEMFNPLAEQAAHTGSACERLRQTLYLFGRLMRTHGDWLGRVLVDASLKDPVAQQFLQEHASRHLRLLLSLLEQAQAEGAFAPMPALRRFSFVLGAVAAPMLVAPRAMQLGVLPDRLLAQATQDVLSDAAIAERVDRALAALALPLPTSNGVLR